MINFYNNNKFKIDLKKTINIIKEAIIICIISIIGAYTLALPIIIYKNYDERINNKEITIEDKPIIDKELNANGKDIIIILDSFNKKSEWHGNDVSSYFKSYFKYNLKKEIDIKIINLSFKEQIDKNNIDNIENLDLLEYNNNRLDRYKEISKESYSLETYIKRIRELNPNSKIVLSLSWIKPFTNNKIVSLSKEYNFKIAQSYSNSYSYEGLEWTFFRLFLYDRTNTILVSSLDPKPLWYMKYISVDDFKHTKEFEDKHLWSTSYLTPVLGYEYYLNKDSNIINTKLIEK